MTFESVLTLVRYIRRIIPEMMYFRKISSTAASEFQALPVSGDTGSLASIASMTTLLLRTCHFTEEELKGIDSIAGIKQNLLRKAYQSIIIFDINY